MIRERPCRVNHLRRVTVKYSPVPVFLAFILISAVTEAGGSVTHNLGLSGGFPQMVAVTYRADLAGYLSIEGYAGSLLFFNATGGGRLIVGSTGPGIKPRFFAGVCVVDQYYAEHDSPRGTESYFWGGGGAAYEFPDGFELAADLAYVGKGDRDRGLGYNTGMSFSAGLMFPL